VVEVEVEVELEGLLEWPLVDGAPVPLVLVVVVLVAGVVDVELVVVVDVGVVVVVVVVVEGGGQDSETDFTGTVRLREEIGAPGGSWKYRTWPLSRVTVTVQLAAEAAGSAATPNTAAMTPSVASATLSFPRLNTEALSPPADISRAPVHPRHDSMASY
jgi:hypothetical protein